MGVFNRQNEHFEKLKLQYQKTTRDKKESK